MAILQIEQDTKITKSLTVEGSVNFAAGSFTENDLSASTAIPRSKLAQDALTKYVVPLTDLRVWDAFQTNLPGTPATDDLGLVGGTFGTASPSVQTEDLKAAGATNKYARFMVRLPAEYDSGETVTIRLHAGMVTTVADTTATIDIEAYLSDKESGIGLDLCTTSATTINSLTLADKDFTITPTSMVAGDWLDVRITVAINDAATGTAVIGMIGSIELLCDVKG